MRSVAIILCLLLWLGGCGIFKKSTQATSVLWTQESFEYEALANFENGLARAKKRGKWGLVDVQGNIKLPFEYYSIGKKSEDLLVVCKANGYAMQCGVLDSVLNTVIPLKYERISDFHGERALTKVGNKIGYMTPHDGGVLLDSLYNNGRNFYNGVTMVLKDSLWAMVDDDLHQKTAFEYKDPDSFENGFCRAEYNGKVGFLATDGQVAIPFEYQDGGNFGNGLFPVKKDSLWGYVDQQNTQVIPLNYNYASEFRDERAVVRNDSLLGFIDTEGNLITPLKYERASLLQNGLARVQKDGKWGFVNRSGELVITPAYEDAHQFNNGYAPAKLNGKWGLIDQNNQEVLEFKYDKVSDISVRGFGWVFHRGTYQLFSLKI